MEKTFDRDRRDGCGQWDELQVQGFFLSLQKNCFQRFSSQQYSNIEPQVKTIPASKL